MIGPLVLTMVIYPTDAASLKTIDSMLPCNSTFLQKTSRWQEHHDILGYLLVLHIFVLITSWRRLCNRRTATWNLVVKLLALDIFFPDGNNLQENSYKTCAINPRNRCQYFTDKFLVRSLDIPYFVLVIFVGEADFTYCLNRILQNTQNYLECNLHLQSLGEPEGICDFLHV